MFISPDVVHDKLVSDHLEPKLAVTEPGDLVREIYPDGVEGVIIADGKTELVECAPLETVVGLEVNIPLAVLIYQLEVLDPGLDVLVPTRGD